MPERPKITLKGDVTVAPSSRFTKYTVAPSADGVLCAITVDVPASMSEIIDARILVFIFFSLVVIDNTAHSPYVYNTMEVVFIQLLGKKKSEHEIRKGLPVLFPRLWRYGLILAGNQDDAMDLAQTTCLRALEKAENYQAGTRLDSWLFKMEQRIWVNEIRSRKVRRGNGLQAFEEINIPDPGPNQNTNFFVRQVLSSIYELPEAQRATVLLVYVEGYKYAEASGILNVPVGTIMSRLAAARKTVSERMTRKSKAIK